ncbi:MAG: PAS domain-containing protein [Sneathiellales bacterium]|nr:PAS domain-containing protein [Sneathiellales bacterium]
MTNLELNTYMSDDVPEEKTPSAKRPLQIGLVIAACLIAGCYFASNTIIGKRQANLLEELNARQQIAAAGKADIMKTWLEETLARANQIVEHPLFQLFASELNTLKSDDLPKPLAEQLPYMQNAMTSFVQRNDIVAAYLMGENGRAYLASSNAPTLSDEQREKAVSQYRSTSVSITNLRVMGSQLVFDFVIPVLPVQKSEKNSTNAVSGVLVMTVSATKQLQEMLEPTRLSSKGEISRFFQAKEGALYLVDPEKEPFISDQASALSGDQAHEFQLRTFDNLPEKAYSVASLVDGTNWLFLQGERTGTALAPLQTFAYAVYGLAVSAFVVVMSILSGIWLSLRSSNAKAMADQYRDFAHQINAQRRLLGSINNTIEELIGLTDPNGSYVYANPALANFVNFPLQAITTKTDRDLFGDQTARQLADLDKKVVETRQSVNSILELEINGETRILRVEKSRLLDDNMKFMGIVTVAGDITDYIQHQRKKEELGRKTISILVHMMEDNDPYLAGHSHRMSELSLAIAGQMGLPSELKETLQTGANLSQIGKISIPTEIRTKESRLTDDEMTIMRGHVDKAEKLLSDMEIDPNIITAVTHMYERMDGSGYPKQLTGNDVEITGRILGITDILVARISPRSYRQAISVEEAMEVFRTNPEKYDQEVVAALDAFLLTPEGDIFKDRISD